MRCGFGQQMTDKDRKLIDDAKKEIEERMRKFYQRNQVDEDTRQEAAQAWLAWAQSEREAGNPFYHAPLAMKSFIVGFAMAKKGLTK